MRAAATHKAIRRRRPRTPDEDPTLNELLGLLVNDMVAASDLTTERATERVYRVAQLHLDYLPSMEYEEHLSHTLGWVVENVQEDMIEGSGDLPGHVRPRGAWSHGLEGCATPCARPR